MTVWNRPLLALGVCCAMAMAQQAGPSLSIDPTSERKPISPDIYGVNFSWEIGKASASDYKTKSDLAVDLRSTTRRWGGNNTSTYHWKFDVWNIDNDWFYEVLPDTSINASQLPNGSSFNQFVDQARISGGKVLGTVPILGLLPKARTEMCSFSVAKYGKQCKQDPYAKYHPLICGNGIQYDDACGDPSAQDRKAPKSPVYLKNDPSDAYAPYDASFQTDWIRYLVSRYGKANQGGIAIWSLDNEPIWWDSTHRDIHPNPYTYDELLALDTAYAEAIKVADPTALVSGPVGDNWSSLFLSKKDIVAGGGNYWSNPVDRNAHGGVALLPWYLQQMRNYEQTHGFRLLDYLDMHAYLEPGAVDNGSDAASNATRLDATRRFWDPTAVVSGDYWIRDIDNKGAPIAPQLIPRLRGMIDQNYPGTKLALTEYNFGRLDTLNGALAQAELLGIFGREGVDLATLWGPTKPTDPAAFAFKIYRNYDGIGGAFGDTGVRAASTDAGKLSIFAAEQPDHSLTAMVINKTGNDLASNVDLNNFEAGSPARVWRYSGAKLDSIVAEDDVPVADGGLSTTFPANSMTLLVIPPARYAVPKPEIAAATNAASYDRALAPGQMVIVFGKNMGPSNLALLRQDDNGLVSTKSGEVRVLFDGVPGPIVYASATQCSAVVPYFGAVKNTTHVQVEYQGVRSDPMEIAVTATAPGVFTNDASGKGQGAILNQDGITRNSAQAPASPGSEVILWATGEGVTDPPGVDGRVAAEILPRPLASLSVEIGGVPAIVDYAGGAPGMIPGIIQINVRVPKDAASGNAVLVHIKIGSMTSQDGVTLAIR